MDKKLKNAKVDKSMNDVKNMYNNGDSIDETTERVVIEEYTNDAGQTRKRINRYKVPKNFKEKYDKDEVDDDIIDMVEVTDDDEYDDVMELSSLTDDSYDDGKELEDDDDWEYIKILQNILDIVQKKIELIKYEVIDNCGDTQYDSSVIKETFEGILHVLHQTSLNTNELREMLQGKKDVLYLLPLDGKILHQMIIKISDIIVKFFIHTIYNSLSVANLNLPVSVIFKQYTPDTIVCATTNETFNYMYNGYIDKWREELCHISLMVEQELSIVSDDIMVVVDDMIERISNIIQDSMDLPISKSEFDMCLELTHLLIYGIVYESISTTFVDMPMSIERENKLKNILLILENSLFGSLPGENDQTINSDISVDIHRLKQVPCMVEKHTDKNVEEDGNIINQNTISEAMSKISSLTNKVFSDYLSLRKNRSVSDSIIDIISGVYDDIAKSLSIESTENRVGLDHIITACELLSDKSLVDLEENDLNIIKTALSNKDRFLSVLPSI